MTKGPRELDWGTNYWLKEKLKFLDDASKNLKTLSTDIENYRESTISGETVKKRLEIKINASYDQGHLI